MSTMWIRRYAMRLAGLVVLALPAFSGGSVQYESFKLVASDGADEDEFGAAVGMDGDTVAVSAPGDDDNGANSGSVYIFRRTETGWVEEAKLHPTDPQPGGDFGRLLLLDGDTLAVSSRGDGAMPNTGLVYVFARAGLTWTQQARLFAPDGQTADGFGPVALEGDRLVVGASLADTTVSQAGAAYSFVRQGTSWSLEAKLTPSAPIQTGQFGGAVSLSGESMLISQRGRGYLYKHGPLGWVEETQFAPSDPSVFTGYNSGVIDGRLAIMGAPYDSDRAHRAGAVYVYEDRGSGWGLTAKVYAARPFEEGNFGEVLALEDGLSIVQTGWDVFVYTWTGSAWTEEFQLKAKDSNGIYHELGWRFDISGREMIVGDPLEGVGSFFFGPGAAYIYEVVDTQSFCDVTDDSLAMCPCSNPGHPESGCATANGEGVELQVVDQDPLAGRATLSGRGFDATSTSPAIVVRSATHGVSQRSAFGDGVRCVGAPVTRMGAAPAAAGVSMHDIGHGTSTGTYAYQLWFRSTPGPFCTSASFNLSNGRTLTW